MQQPLISVIVPAYNLEDCLGRALDSILKQGIKEMEVIVVDDLSSDGTWELIKKYEKKIVELYRFTWIIDQNLQEQGMQHLR